MILNLEYEKNWYQIIKNYKEKSKVKKIIVPIGGKAPKNCTELFKDYTNLVQITNLNYINFSKTEEIKSMFENCHNINHITIESKVSKKTNSINNLYKNCYKLTKTDLKWLADVNIDNKYQLKSTFENCYELITINLSDIKKIKNGTLKLYQMTNLFKNCDNLTLRGIEQNLFRNNSDIRLNNQEYQKAFQIIQKNVKNVNPNIEKLINI